VYWSRSLSIFSMKIRFTERREGAVWARPPNAQRSATRTTAKVVRITRSPSPLQVLKQPFGTDNFTGLCQMDAKIAKYEIGDIAANGRQDVFVYAEGDVLHAHSTCVTVWRRNESRRRLACGTGFPACVRCHGRPGPCRLLSWTGVLPQTSPSPGFLHGLPAVPTEARAHRRPRRWHLTQTRMSVPRRRARARRNRQRLAVYP
jgi:hypothetical protein